MMFLLTLLLATLCFALVMNTALRNYSRSRLERLCQPRCEDRLESILAHATDAALAFRFSVWLLLGLAATSQGFRLIEAHRAGDADAMWALTVQFVGAAIVLGVLELWIFVPIGRALATPLVFWTWPVVGLLRVFIVPLLAGQRIVLRWLKRLTGDGDDLSPIQDEILSVVTEGEREGAINQDAADMIEGLFELHQSAVSEVMTPRTDMVMLQQTDTVAEASRVIVEAGHSRIPVYGKTRDEILGILYAKDLLPYFNKEASGSDDLTKVHLRRAVYVPESKPVHVLLREFQRGRVHIAIVLDEYGGVAGLVTIEDILEEIVGEIDDEYDPAQEPTIRRISEHVVEVDARIHVDEANALLGPLLLPENADYDTVGGFVFSTLGRIPKTGEKLQHEQTLLTILDASDRTINRIRIEVTSDQTVTSPDD